MTTLRSQVTDVRNVVVVVSRWFGGIELGPARFTHINNAARELLVEQGYVATAGNHKASSGKRK
jgi:putative IMPACT (imprinted ancient) family translation regulator